jgi:pyruvate/2-oxoglutarate dehydrogenase complex dihydrolipoamide acyltransferase (E2) component
VRICLTDSLNDTIALKLGKDGEIIPYTAMALSLSYDHRALDGAPASRFLKDLKDYLENFSVNLMADSI